MREHFAAFSRILPGTPGTPAPHSRCSGGEGHETPVPQGFQDAGTPGTPGTPENNEIGRELGSACEAPAVASPNPETAPQPAAATPVVAPTPAVELAPAAYDRIADALIAAAGEGTNEAGRLRHMKKKGSVLPDGDRKVFTRGRF